MDAVIRNFEIIGEAANNLSDEFRDQHPSVDWHRIRGFRNRIVHDYMGIDYKLYGILKKLSCGFLTSGSDQFRRKYKRLLVPYLSPRPLVYTIKIEFYGQGRNLVFRRRRFKL